MSKVHYEYRTSKVTVAVCDTLELAHKWASKKPKEYVEALKLVKVTTFVSVEAA